MGQSEHPKPKNSELNANKAIANNSKTVKHDSFIHDYLLLYTQVLDLLLEQRHLEVENDIENAKNTTDGKRKLLLQINGHQLSHGVQSQMVCFSLDS